MKSLFLLIAYLLFATTNAQYDTTLLHHRKIRAQDVMWQKTLWRQVNLEYPTNVSFFQDRNEISTQIIKYIVEGKLSVYENDSLELGSKLSIEEFKSQLEIKTLGQRDSLSEKEYFNGTDITEIEIKEVYIFDKLRSQLVIQPTSILLYIPHDHPLNPYGIQVPIGAISFIELEKVEQRKRNARWYNPYNEVSDLSFTEAILMRKFHSHVVRVSNPWNEYLDEYMSEKEAYWAGIRIENQIREFEYNLWCDHP